MEAHPFATIDFDPEAYGAGYLATAGRLPAREGTQLGTQSPKA